MYIVVITTCNRIEILNAKVSKSLNIGMHQSFGNKNKISAE